MRSSIYDLFIDNINVGTVGLTGINKESTVGEKHIFIHDLEITEKCRGKGYGNIIMKQIEKVSLQKDKTKLMLSVYCYNSKAINLYKKYGFKIRSRVENKEFSYYKMTKKISPVNVDIS